MLAALARAVGKRPFDQETVVQASKAIYERLGEGVMIEAASGVAGMEIATRSADLTGREGRNTCQEAILTTIMIAIRFLSSWWA